MSHSVEKIALKSQSPGTQRFLTVHKFLGIEKGPKVYLQAALHADEWPGLLTLQHMIEQLIDLDSKGNVLGEIIIVPYANPIGMDQKLNGVVLGRQSFSSEGNFNRNWPDFSFVTENLLREDLVISVNLVKDCLLKAVAKMPVQTALQQLKATLLSLSIDADIVLDLHCDSQALVHLYTNYRHKDLAEQLASFIQSPILLLEDEPGGAPFDAAHIRPWTVLQNTGITHDCFAATVELRGFADVSDELAKIDAQGLLGFLAAQNVINYRFQEMSKSTVFSTYLSAVDSVSAPSSGIVCWQVSLGEKVAEGQLVGEIVNLEAENPTLGRVPIYSRTEGVLFATAIGKLVCEGENIAKIAGTKEMQNALGADLLTL